jgi:arylsulfatase
MARQTDRFNVLLITTDTQRTDTLASYGHPHALSPNLDRLAREGILFEQGHTPSPVCMPARCSLMTGVHTPVHGCIENGVQRHTHLPVLPDLLQAAGYTNIMVGKTHFGPVPDSFDVQYVLKGEKNAASDDWYAQHLRQHGYDRNSRHPNQIPEELFCESFLVDTTIREIERVTSAGRGPFFAFCSMLSPHEPFDPPGRWATLYDDRPLPPLNYLPGEEARHPRHLRTLLGMDHLERMPKRTSGEPDLASIDVERRLYYGSAAYCDAQVGRLMAYLDQTGLRQNTLVIFTSDHGTQLYDHGFKDKHNYYDASWRVPFILSLPGTLPQGERRDFAIWNDLTATILAAAGTSCPTMQAFDLFTPLREGKASPRRCAVGTLYKSCGLATSRWKLEYYFEEGLGRLFDRVNDPLERVDLYDQPDFHSLRHDLVQALLTWRADILDLHWLQGHTGTGGPVATRLAGYTRTMRGDDPERRLNESVQAIDKRYAGL